MTGPDVVAFWLRRGGITAVAVEEAEVVGYGAVIPLQGWSSHVGEVRVIVDPGHRRHGVGRALARQAVLASLELGLTKLVVEVIADDEPTIAMFRSLGFDPEALLEDQVRDQSGELHDLMILALSVEESWASHALDRDRRRPFRIGHVPGQRKTTTQDDNARRQRR